MSRQPVEQPRSGHQFDGRLADVNDLDRPLLGWIGAAIWLVVFLTSITLMVIAAYQIGYHHGRADGIDWVTSEVYGHPGKRKQ